MRLRALATIVAVVAALAIPLGSPAAAGGRPLSATLSGANEFPGPGDPDGTGTASITVNPGQREVCFKLHVAAITLPAIAAHIHAGAIGVAGPVVVTLTPPSSSGDASGCVGGLDRGLLIKIIQHPSLYYVNVHTGDFAGGALRGQLSKGHGGEGDDEGGGGGGGGASNVATATLKGSNEVPVPGDPDGTGTATVTLMPSLGEVCYSLTVSNIMLPAIAADIDAGAAGVAGAVVVTLAAPGTNGTVSGCVVGLNTTLVQSIQQNPSAYYVNVHTADYPNGALRGQLSGSSIGGGGGNGGGDDNDDNQGDED